MAEFDALFAAKEPHPLVEPPRQGGVAPAQQAQAQPAPPQTAPPQTAPAQPVSPQVAPAQPFPSQPDPVALAQAQPNQVQPLPPQMSSAPAAPIREVVTAPEVSNRPAGHWSNQASIDDEYQITELSVSRNLAASDAITTNALVLPSFPHSGPMIGPVSSTGEILMTGSIDLPRSMGISGLNPSRYEPSDVDAVIDAADREDSAPDSAPVRAIRAVSTYTSSRGIIATKRPKDSKLPMILSVTAGVMAVGVIVLFVAGMIFKIF